MHLTSPAFENNGSIPKKYTGQGENINPPLLFSDIPDGTQSLVLLMDDPDVPKSIRPDGMWDHWVVFNIPPRTLNIEADSTPPGIVGLSTRGVNQYGGPNPPDREHRYFFKLYALDVMLDLESDSTKTDVEQAMQGHIIDKVELMGRYERD